MKLNSPVYLGDGVYLSPWPEMGGALLTTSTHDQEMSDNKIWLEPSVIKALLEQLGPEKSDAEAPNLKASDQGRGS